LVKIIKYLLRYSLTKFGSAIAKRNDADFYFGSHGYHIFGGYHDVTIANEDAGILLAHRTSRSFDLTTPRMADVGYFEYEQRDFIKIDETYAWSWQQGSRLSWLDNDELLFGYNSAGNEDVGYKLVSLKTGEVTKFISSFVYDLNLKQDLFSSVDFEELSKFRRGYGYLLPNGVSSRLNQNRGIKVGRISDEHPIVEIRPEDIGISSGYLNHAKFNSTGTFLVFLACSPHSEGRKRQTSLWYVCLTDLSMGQVGTAISHFCWIDEHSLLVTRRDIIQGVAYEIIYFDTPLPDVNKSEKVKLSWMPWVDGHPSVSFGDLIVTDSYPNRLGFQSLFIGSLDCATYKLFKQYHSPLDFRGEIRSDLHPRFSSSRHCVDCDIVFKTGLRGIAINSLPRHVQC